MPRARTIREPVYEYNAAGVLVDGPQLKQPSWYRDAKSGNATPSHEPASNVLSRQRYERSEKVRRHHARLLTAATGARVGANRRAA